MNLYRSNSNSLEPSSLRSIVINVCIILQAQELNNDLWESNSVKLGFNLLLSISMHDSGKVRRCVQECITPLLEYHFNSGFMTTSRLLVRQLEVLSKSFNEEDYHEVINYLLFFSKVISFIHASFYPTLTSILLTVFHSYSIDCCRFANTNVLFLTIIAYVQLTKF